MCSWQRFSFIHGTFGLSNESLNAIYRFFSLFFPKRQKKKFPPSIMRMALRKFDPNEDLQYGTLPIYYSSRIFSCCWESRSHCHLGFELVPTHLSHLYICCRTFSSLSWDKSHGRNCKQTLQKKGQNFKPNMYLLDYKKNIRFDFDGELKIRYVSYKHLCN